MAGSAESFYGPTIRDRLWMWGHHAQMCGKSFPKDCRRKWEGPAVEQSEGCRMMGIANDFVVRCANLPSHPWGDYMEQFRSLKRFSFGITDGGNGTVREKMRWAFEELQPNFPNFTGCVLDDYFRPDDIGQGEVGIEQIAGEVHDRGLRLSIVLYSDQDGLKPEFLRPISFCDEVSYWVWRSANIGTMEDSVRRCRDFIGEQKDLLLGLYMWDYTLGEPVSGERMSMQLDCAGRLLADRTVTGLVFHPSYAAALDVPPVVLAKRWIADHGERRWGLRT